MHTDLSPHLHTDVCNEIIKVLRQCWTDHPRLKYLGKCDHEYVEMIKCLKQERINRRQKNFEMSKQRKEKLNNLFKEQSKARKDNISSSNNV
ncbi:COX assembly mitochondrial protein 2 homolog [Euwallacea fornicatus]|uniref:COX assembly mitochondrial protein 2 homolog n=1 Tax=Euwallacea fornicatus TaxID=995702 RepID=UPI00338FC63B